MATTNPTVTWTFINSPLTSRFNLLRPVCLVNLYLFCSSQTCYFIFIVEHNVTLTNVVETSVTGSGSDDLRLIPANSNWDLLSMNAQHSPLVVQKDQIFTQIDISITIKRKGSYYFINLFAPSFILSILELACFLLPPETPDRATFACTIMLSIFVLQAQFIDNIPKTPRPVMATNYILGELIYAMACVIYSGLMCAFVDRLPHKAERKIDLGSMGFKEKFKIYQVIDYIAFIIAGIILIMFTMGMLLFLEFS